MISKESKKIKQVLEEYGYFDIVRGCNTDKKLRYAMITYLDGDKDTRLENLTDEELLDIIIYN